MNQEATITKYLLEAICHSSELLKEEFVVYLPTIINSYNVLLVSPPEDMISTTSLFIFTFPSLFSSFLSFHLPLTLPLPLSLVLIIIAEPAQVEIKEDWYYTIMCDKV